VWFVLEGQKLYLLPVKGSETQWYNNVLYKVEEPSRCNSKRIRIPR
jgi:hypothetical protein